MTDQGELYGEVPASHVDPGLLWAAEKTLAYCMNRYAVEGKRAPKIRWLRKGQFDNAIARLLDVAKEIGGAEVDALEKGHDAGGGFAGFTRRAQASGGNRERWGNSIFLLDELSPRAGAYVAAHEFYHLFYKTADEAEADDFARRVMRLMGFDESEAPHE